MEMITRYTKVKEFIIQVRFMDHKFSYRWNGKTYFSQDKLAKALGMSDYDFRRKVRS